MTKRTIHTEMRTDAHAYTRSKVSWTIGSFGKTFGDVVYYIAGGGMRAFGRTVRQDAARIRQRRFLAVAAAFAVLWLCFWVF